jgi:hypothetical protein
LVTHVILFHILPAFHFCQYGYFKGHILVFISLLLQMWAHTKVFSHAPSPECFLLTALLLGSIFNPEDGGSTFFQNTGELVLNYTVSHPTWWYSSQSILQEPQIQLCFRDWPLLGHLVVLAYLCTMRNIVVTEIIFLKGRGVGKLYIWCVW